MAQDSKQTVADIVRFALITLIIVVPIRAYVAQPFIVSGVSMDPTYHDGEYLIIDELSYHFRSPKRGEVVVFRYPKDPSKYFIKRVVGLPGETISFAREAITIKKGEQSWTIKEPYLTDGISYQAEVIELGPEEYLVLGDNRNLSLDSRSWGPVQEKLIKGRVLVRLLPLSEIQLLPGDFSNADFLN
ncbi:MAG: signal peptidase I [Candidatus Vogelbacteria bacterium RIFOXYD1_FULL_46_19]|uniref:Signal peptidase I n=1 Tax=Candidatus Vogelbacteria bacterium RIFOXYD1_FULL_46_19 TaxID=1802439 RepID=A0A1G2QGZ3_9BACT|nr:MAG: signal peptidase I [Candidatus Vogelbacteria bacterium RIFOXYD1_FULL_46_19]